MSDLIYEQLEYWKGVGNREMFEEKWLKLYNINEKYKLTYP